MHAICQQTLIASFSNSELQRHGMNVEGLLANPNLIFVDWIANKDPDFTATGQEATPTRLRLLPLARSGGLSNAPASSHKTARLVLQDTGRA
jgi:hypothetical protein